MDLGAQESSGLIGQVIGGYRLVEEKGRGATGVVFLGQRVEEAASVIERTNAVPLVLPAEAAVKVLVLPWQLTSAEREGFRARFKREAQILRRLQHPHILPVLTSDDDPVTGHAYMVLPLMAQTLGQYRAMLRGPMPEEEIAGLLGQVATALDYAHSQNVIHRDIKPGNILLDGQGQAYLSDFSIVHVVSVTSTRLTSTGRALGTPEYMAPEQFDDASKVGPAADLYGLGMVVYELVSGRVAFSATSWAQVMKAQLQDPPPLPRALRPDLPEPAEAAILRALAKDPAQRFVTAAAFAHAFSLGLAGQWDAGLTRYAPSRYAPSRGAIGGAGYEPITHGAHMTEPRITAQPTVPPAAAPRRAPWVLLGAAAALALIIACCATLTFGPWGGALLALAGPHATATTAAAASTVTSAPASSHTPAAKPTATAHKSGGGGVAGGGGGGGANPTATPMPAPTATFTPVPPPTATFTPVPPPTPTFTPTPVPGPAITISWSTAHPTWLKMIVYRFTPGAYHYYCNFSTPPQSFGPYTISISGNPQTFDGGNTCYDQQSGDHIWVTINGVTSNTLTVP